MKIMLIDDNGNATMVTDEFGDDLEIGTLDPDVQDNIHKSIAGQFMLDAIRETLRQVEEGK